MFRNNAMKRRKGGGINSEEISNKGTSEQLCNVPAIKLYLKSFEIYHNIQFILSYYSITYVLSKLELPEIGIFQNTQIFS